MPLRNLRPVTFRPKGLTDAVDGTNAFPGAMSSLVNLVPAPSTASVFVPRPAAQKLTNFPGFANPGVVSALTVIGTRAYGLLATSRFAGHDEPFCYDLVGNAFIAVSGVTVANTPLTQSTVGDWTPPTMAAPTATRVIVTHPGFPGGGGAYFGWFDISSFSTVALKGNIAIGSPVITSIYDGSTSAPILDGVMPGQTVVGAGIPASTTVVSVTNGTFSLGTTGDTHGSTTLDNLASTTGVAVGMIVSGPQFAAGTYVAAIVSSVHVTLSTAALGSAAGTAVNFSGGGTITLSNNAAANTNLLALTIAGGTPAAPLWNAGNTNTNPLSAVPTAVAPFNNRAWFAVGNAAVYSDVLNPTQVSLASQALILGDNTSITALSPLPLTSPITGGIIQALVAFKADQPLWQITGDAATANLALNINAGTLGTFSPRSICGTPLGLAFVAPDGLRILSEAGSVTDPIGSYGKGVSVPMINAVYPTRMAAQYNHNTLRISVQNAQVQGQPVQDYWLNFTEKIWTGPHTFPASVVCPCSALGPGVDFILAYDGLPGILWSQGTLPQPTSVYVENGNPLSWSWQTVLLPDNEQLSMNAMVKTAVTMLLVAGQTVAFAAFDESSNLLAQVSLTSAQMAGTAVWGSSTWGSFLWGGLTSVMKQYRLPWPTKLVFKQAFIAASGASAASFSIGNLYMGFQPLGYLLEDWVVVSGVPLGDFILDQSQLGGTDVLA